MIEQDATSSSGDDVQPRWVVPLWILMAIWIAFVSYRAADELSSDRIVKGLVRDYHPPVELANGWVIDPSRRPLHLEIIRRYAPDKEVKAPDGVSIETWTTWLSEINLKPRIVSNKTPERVHLRFLQNGRPPELWIGRFGIEHIVYRSEVGVVQLNEVQPAHAVIELTGAEVRPW